jgi:glycosyltransferase involved in cell wall biosynthesis
VGVAAPIGSQLPKGVKLIETTNPRYQGGFETEILAYYNYSAFLRDYEVVHDFSHQHVAAMRDNTLKAINVFWHDPYIAKYPEPSYNCVAISDWQAKRFNEVYKQGVMYIETICADPEKYKLGKERGDFYLYVGKMSHEKGCLEAIKICRDLGVKLAVVGGKGIPSDPDDYMNMVIDNCDDKQIVWYGNCSDQVKIHLMQTAKALIYPVMYEEAHSHKMVEGMMCGCPCVTYDRGAMKEVVEDGVTGFVVKTEEQFKQAMKKVEELDCETIRKVAVERWAREKVVKNYADNVYPRVAEGLKW